MILLISAVMIAADNEKQPILNFDAFLGISEIPRWWEVIVC